jgi:hypothetical protein
MTLSVPGRTDESLSSAADEFDSMHPGNVSPFIAYLATAGCPIKGRVFFVSGGHVQLFQPYAIIDSIEKKDGRWTVAELQAHAAHFADVPFDLRKPF